MNDKQVALLTLDVWLVGFILAWGLDAADWAQWSSAILMALAWIVYVLKVLDEYLAKRERRASIAGRCEHGQPWGESCYRCDRKKVR